MTIDSRLAGHLTFGLLTMFGLLAVWGSQPVPRATGAAPPLGECHVSGQRELGSWDDVFAPEDLDGVYLRRDGNLFTLPMLPDAEPRLLAGAPLLHGTRMVACAGATGRRWIFLNASSSVPLALDAGSGEIRRFDVSGLRVPGDGAPHIQSHVILPHANAALLMISGGDRRTWPREGNRPVYFWMGLADGEVKQFPIGWDLEYFSADQRLAVFARPSQRPFQRRPLQAVDMETGMHVAKTPRRGEATYVPFHWTETGSVQPVYQRREETGADEQLLGISVRGQVLRLDPPERNQPSGQELAQARVNDGFVAFRLRSVGTSPVSPSRLWLTRLRQLPAPRQLAAKVTNFVLLEDGNCVYVTTGHGLKQTSEEVFFRDPGGNSAWNVLEGLPRLPALDRRLAEKDYIEDRLIVRLHQSFGSGRRMVLCRARHARSDARAFVFPPAEDETIERTDWRRSVLVSSDGGRWLTRLFREGNPPDKIWLHDSGTVLLGIVQQAGVRLTRVTLEIPRERPNQRSSE